jgi:alpha-beta hydrolase superfamily lysophospholipase
MASSDLQAEDGRIIPVCCWQPEFGEAPKAIVQIFHGLGEYAGRYERFADACRGNQLAVVAHDHRGHGKSARPAGHFADRDGWDKLIADAFRVNRRIKTDFPGVPVVLFGHSMGSYIAQSFVMRHPDSVSMLILSASTLARRTEVQAGHTLANLFSIFGKRTKTKFLNAMGFDAFNKPFEPARTEFDWLSRDEAVVDQYIADPLCGGLFSNQLWRDLTGGLLEITSAGAVARIPADLPVVIMGGQDDPVGGEKGLNRLADAFRETGHRNLMLKIYAGARHEMLNETNRDEVTGDVIDWITERLLRFARNDG